MIVTWVAEPTGTVAIEKLAVEEPAGTSTDPGTPAAPELDDSDTVVPPPGAAALNVTTPVEPAPPTTDDGFTETDCNDGAAVTVSEAVFWFKPPSVAVIVTVVSDETLFTVTVKVAELDPAFTVTDDGTAAAALLDASVSVELPVGAAPFNVTVPVTVVGPMTEL